MEVQLHTRNIRGRKYHFLKVTDGSETVVFRRETQTLFTLPGVARVEDVELIVALQRAFDTMQELDCKVLDTSWEALSLEEAS